MDNDKYIGRLLDNRYEILEIIGTGGMAVVYKARCHRLNRLVAIKILKDDLSQDEEFRRRFHAESQAVAMLSHPNIMSVYDVSTTDEADYIVMELIDGITLKQYMEKKGVLNWKETLHFSMQIAKALEHAHSRGLVHRDIKPHNIMVLKNGSVKVTDFGIARIMSNSNTLTKEALGSVHYISPEQARGGRVDNRSDIYSLGVVMYEMMAGRPPYDGESPVAVAIQHINGGAQMPSALNPNIPGGLEQIIMKAMAIEPDKRYASAAGLLNDLEEFRKNPSILFDFNAAGEDTLTAIPVNPDVQESPVASAPPRNTAERVAQRAGGVSRVPASRPRTTEGTQSVNSAEAQRKARQEREEARRRKNRTTFIAVGVCSAVAVVAIVIWLVVLLNGGTFGSDTTLVTVPNLKGQVWEELDTSLYPNFEIVLVDKYFDDNYDEGQIISQSPEAGEHVGVGTRIKVYVSLGSEEEELPTMADLTGMSQFDAEKYLNNLDMGLVPQVMIEYSDTIPEGDVVHTDPEKDTQLERGQTVILYISQGEEIITTKVPDVLGQNVQTAERILNNNGFDNCSLVVEDSLIPKDQVIRMETAEGVEIIPGTDELNIKSTIVVYYSSGEMILTMPYVVGRSETEALQVLSETGFSNVETTPKYDDEVPEGYVIRTNIAGGSKIDSTTAIELTVSMGPEPTTAPETEPPTEPLVTKTVTISLPTDMTEAYTLTVMFNSATVVDETVIQPGTGSIVIQLTGRGTGYYEVYINGDYVRTEKVNFDG